MILIGEVFYASLAGDGLIDWTRDNLCSTANCLTDNFRDSGSAINRCVDCYAYSRLPCYGMFGYDLDSCSTLNGLIDYGRYARKAVDGLI